MNIAYYGGESSGITVLLTLLTTHHQIISVFPEDDNVKKVAQLFNLPIYKKENLNSKNTVEMLKGKCDLFICCHGKKILSPLFVNSIQCINIHPCLYKYKGADPIARLLKDKNSKASVGVHYMTEIVDKGEVLTEVFKNIKNIETKSVKDIYKEIQPLYIEAVLITLKKLTFQK